MNSRINVLQKNIYSYIYIRLQYFANTYIKQTYVYIYISLSKHIGVWIRE